MIGVEKLKNFKSFKIPVNPTDIYKYKLKNFRPKIKLQFETSKYIVKTAESHTELLKALKLRHRVFFEKTKKIVKLDSDKFDMIADHLLLIDKNSKEVVGTYRLIGSNFSKEFYTESEFFIDKIKGIKDPILEMGRACIDSNHRNGIALSLLWRGISQYVYTGGYKYLFGCSSIFEIDIEKVAFIYMYLKSKYYLSELEAYPKFNYKILSLKKYTEFLEYIEPNYEKASNYIPPLLEGYLKAGAKVCSEPALDKKFRCVDFVTILITENLTKTFEKKYKKEWAI